MNERDVFDAALELSDPAQRRAFLEQACGGDPALKQHLEGLLEMHAQLGSFLEGPAPALAAGQGFLSEQPGSLIGPYKLLEQIGEGGMGTVFMAEQTEPIERKVALKIIKPGMDSGLVVARFEAERQALALMDHPNIARVLDAGTTDTHRPYFVMELVKGVPITRYCDERHLTPRSRLELFLTVCHAVQHAHQKGIIHRDLKPSNVLLAEYDELPVAKVIDFGVAKAIGPKLTERTMFTQFGQVIGTVEYMSPEQAKFNALDVDTRSDVYGLGVLLYELLTGTTPLVEKGLRDKPFDEVLRIIREDEPTTPSHRLSTMAELPAIASNRGLDPKKLSGVLRGELDWIVMKCLEKDRDRRYQTANDLALDLQRYLHDDPVEACPPSAIYRIRKFVRRNRGPVLAAVSILLLLLGGIAGTTTGLVRAERAKGDAVRAEQAERTAKETAEEREAETRAVLDFVESRIFAAARPRGEDGGQGPDVKLREAVDAALPFLARGFKEQPLVEARLRMTLGKSYFYLRDGKQAEEQYQAARAIYVKLGPDHPRTLESMMGLANSYGLLGRYADALKLHEETLARQKATLGPDYPNTLHSMHNVALSLDLLGRQGAALELRLQTLALRKASLGPDHPGTLATMMELANSYYFLGRYAVAVKLHEETMARRKATLGPDHPDTLRSMHNLAATYTALNRHAEALKLHLEALELYKTTFGPTHPDTLACMGDLANSYFFDGKRAEALELRKKTLDLQKVRLGLDHPDTLKSMTNLANSYTDAGRLPDALKLHQETLALKKVRLGLDHPDTLRTMGNLAMTLLRLYRSAEAVPIIDECVRRSAGQVVAPGMIAGLLDSRMRHFEKIKDAAGCRATAQMWEQLKRTDAVALYHGALFRAVTATVIRRTDHSAAGRKQADAEADRAMAGLRQAVAAGYHNVAHLRGEKVFDVLRDRDDFKKLLAEMSARRRK